MIVPDVNLLVYAYDSKSPFHEKSKQWLEELLIGDELVGWCPSVLIAFIRLSTNTRMYAKPLSVGEATMIVKEWLDSPVSLILETTAEDCLMALDLLEYSGVSGNLATDALIAATARRLGGILATADRDFAKFGINWMNPLESTQ